MVTKIKNYIEFKHWSFYHFIAFAIPICCIITTYIQKSELKTINKEIIDFGVNNCVEVFPYFFNIFVSKILSIFLVFNKKSYE